MLWVGRKKAKKLRQGLGQGAPHPGGPRAELLASVTPLFFETLEQRLLLNASFVGISPDTIGQHDQGDANGDWRGAPVQLAQDANGTGLFAAFQGPGPVQLVQAAGGSPDTFSDHDQRDANDHRRGAPVPIAQDANGTQLFASLDGPGQVQLVQGADGPRLTVSGTTSESDLTLATKGGDGRFTLAAINLNGPLDSISAPTVDLQGRLVAQGGIDSVVLGNLQNATLALAQPVGTISLGNVQDTSLSASGTIDSLAVNSWIATGNGVNQVTATTLGSLTSRSDFDASLTLSGRNQAAGQGGEHDGEHDDRVDQVQSTLGGAAIGGTIGNDVWHVTGAIGTISTAQLTDSTISASAIETASLGKVTDSSLSASGRIGELSVASWAAGGGGTNQISAASLGSSAAAAISARRWRYPARLLALRTTAPMRTTAPLVTPRSAAR